MLRNRNLWFTLSIINLCVVAFIGAALRTKFLFPLPFIDYRYLLSAHSHFAFGGWVTLILMVLYIDNLLSPLQQQRKIYQVLLWGIQLSSYGMVFSFPFQGYGLFSIIFSTLFILFTYVFAWVFIKDLLQTGHDRSVTWLSIAAILCLVISSAGPFRLAYIMAGGNGNANQMRDALYTFLHFQYNGFFTLSVFALLFHNKLHGETERVKKIMFRFTVLLCSSVPPAIFLSLLWHYHSFLFRSIAVLACLLIVLCLVALLLLVKNAPEMLKSSSRASGVLLIFTISSFVIKMLLNSGTIFPSLGNTVYGYRPIIIGFLHLVFLGLVTFYILSYFIEKNILLIDKKFTRVAVIFFSAAILLNEFILLVNGIGLLMRHTDSIFGWLLWIASLCLFLGTLLVLAARLKVKSLQPGTLKHLS